MKPFAQYPKRRSHQLLVVCALALPLAMVGQLLEQPPPYFQQAYLKASERSAWFGNSVAVSGDTAVVAEYYSAAYIFARKEGRWTREAHLQDLILQGHLETSQKSVAVAGDTVVLGDIDQGVHVFVRNGTNWFRQAHLERFGGGFGWSVALAGDTLVVGAPADDSSVIGVNGDPRDNGAFNSGAAYIFVRDGTNWIQQAYLKASNAGTEDYFGASVAMAGDTVVVRASGEDSNATGVNGNQSDNSALNSGAAYIFVRNGTNWTQQAYLKAYNTGVGNFGSSVAVSGDTVVVGAPGDQNNNAMRSGTAYVFVRSGTNWLYEANLQASNAEAGDGFGGSVAVSEDTVVVGSLLEDSSAMGVNGDEIDNSAADSGAAYVFTRSGTNWIQKAYLKASNTGSIDVFGFSVAIRRHRRHWRDLGIQQCHGDQRRPV